MSYETVIGLEVHAELSTKSKIFCSCSTEFGQKENTQTCPVCLGLPGALPVLNKRVLEYAVKMGMATHCTVHQLSRFARKNYFYPDLPKGYQISQYHEPILTEGYVDIQLKDGRKKIGIERIHLEEDAGKSIHDRPGLSGTGIDLNRAGVPLIEIVSKPDMRSSEEAVAYLKHLHLILRYLDICDGNMEEGSFRCDANISVRKHGEIKLGTKVELKNINSFKFVKKGIEFEVDRQIQLVESGQAVVQETRLFDSASGKTFSMRSKEEAHDYRYFTDPDLLTVEVTDEMIASFKQTMPELPTEKQDRFVSEYGIPAYDASVLAMDQTVADFFEHVAKSTQDYKLTSNWVMGEVLRFKKDTEKSSLPISADHLIRLIMLIKEGAVSNSIAKTILEETITTGKAPDAIVKEKNLTQISDDSAIRDIVQSVLNENKDKLAEYLSGKQQLYGFFMGQCMKRSKGQVNPPLLDKMLRDMLELQKTK